MSSFISVLLPVRNGLPFLIDALNSILHQTYGNFELIVVDDGSTDGTGRYLSSLSDARLKIFSTSGIGLVDALNLGLSKCRGELIARMDADDIALPTRLEIQELFLRKNLGIGVVCTDIESISEDGNSIGYERERMKGKEQLLAALTFRESMKPIVHPTVMYRRSAIGSQYEIYRNYYCSEDRDLWLRLASNVEFHRIATPLLRYRHTASGISRSKRLEQAAGALTCTLNYQIEQAFGTDLYQHEPEIWASSLRRFGVALQPLVDAEAAFELIKSSVRSKAYILAIWQFSVGFFRHGRLLFRSDRLRFQRLLIDSETRIISNILEVVPRSLLRAAARVRSAAGPRG